MRSYVAKRLLLFVPTLAGAGILIFLLMRVVPGDVAFLIVSGSDGPVQPEHVLQGVRQRLGLDRPLVEQFAHWAIGIFRGDLGSSFYSGQPVAGEILRRFPVDVELVLMSVILSLVLGVIFGIISAFFQDRWPDYIVRVISIGALSMPAFWVGILVLVYLVRFANWSPPLEFVGFFDNPIRNLGMVALPAAIVGLRNAGITARMARATLLEVLHEDYVRTAWAKGLSARRVIVGHAVPNAMLPVITLQGIGLVAMIGNLVIIEELFRLPGIARYVFTSIVQRDIPAVEGTVLVLVAAAVVINLLVDLSYALVDPRIRYD